MDDIVKRLRSNKVTLVGTMKAGKSVRDNMLDAANEIERLRAALDFYRDPFAWKKTNDPGDDVRVPDFYSETSFGDTAEVALQFQQKGDQKNG